MTAVSLKSSHGGATLGRCSELLEVARDAPGGYRSSLSRPGPSPPSGRLLRLPADPHFPPIFPAKTDPQGSVRGGKHAIQGGRTQRGRGDSTE